MDIVETHMAWVFLTDRHAYKLKKPVAYEFLDFRTLEARREDCRAELRLNRRLAPDVYLGTVRLTREASGRLALDGEGETVDWLVKMVRLPEERMLDRALEAGSVSPEDVRRAGRFLAEFWLRADPVEMTAEAYRARFLGYISENRRELSREEFGLDASRVSEVASTQVRFVTRRREMLDGRVRSGRIVDGHGDLRPEHIHLGPRPAVIDCVEFEREFRLLDPAEELSFLGLECERAGAPEVGEAFLEAYAEVTADRPPPPLLAFYRSHRAALRAKLAVWHARDDGEDPDEWRALAAEYLEIAWACGPDMAARAAPAGPGAPRA